MKSTGSLITIAATLDGTCHYDFKPFLSAPTVVERSKQNGGVLRPLHLPESVIPSPLARNILPDQLLGLKARLVGSGPETSSRTGNGGEVWLSWKRAWDLWNNHYIHGRVNPIWVKGEWERRQKREQPKNNLNRVFGKAPDATTDGNGGSPSSTCESDERISCLSGGFQAIKDFPEFKAPPPFDPDMGDDGIVWDDLINNTVWAPRRVGEKTAKVDLDTDSDEFLRNSHLERDRGVDCGRLPYPLLRPLIEYVQLENGAFMKKKIWDGVIGTVFNLPTKPLVSTQDLEDEKLKMVGQMFGDLYPAFKPIAANEDIFPLDIRRIERVYPVPPFPKNIPPLLENAGDLLLYDRHSKADLPSFKYRNMLQDDPWYMTKEQRILMDYPPRRYPPPEQKYKSEVIPVDDVIFREEFDSDQLKFTGYFVTNQHGGTLIINGVEVQKGDIAGPLPRFAVIECPGGQIAFWFGSYGRNHLAGTEDNSPVKWAALRQQNGWKYTALSAGQVWNAKIKDIIERKKSGEDEHDDEQWEELLSVVAPEESSTPTAVSYQLPLPGQRRGDTLPLPDNIAQPHVMFSSEKQELAWLTAQRDQHETEEIAMDIDLLPGEAQYFPGSQPLSDYVKHRGLTQDKVDDIWMATGENMLELQRIHVSSIRDEEDRKARAEEERLKSHRVPAKRKNEGISESRPKKPRTAGGDIRISDEELEEELQQELEPDLPVGVQPETVIEMERRWNSYMAHKREQQRKRDKEEAALQGEVRKKDKGNLAAKNCPSADAEVKWKILHERDEAIRAGQLQIEKQKQRAREDAKFREFIKSRDKPTKANIHKTNDMNSINKSNDAHYEQPKDFTPAESKNQTTKDIKSKPKQPSQPTVPVDPMPKIIIHPPKSGDHAPKLDIQVQNTTPGTDVLFDDFSSTSDHSSNEHEQQDILKAMELSKQSLRDNARQVLYQTAIAAHKTVPEYLAEEGFGSVEEYIDIVTVAPPPPNLEKPEASMTPSELAQKDLESFLATLRRAYIEGSKARAKLQNMTWKKYTQTESCLDPDDYVNVMVESINITAGDMPARWNKEMDTTTDERIRREKWSALCDLIIQANDFEAQTLVASLPSEKHSAVDGKSYTVI